MSVHDADSRSQPLRGENLPKKQASPISKLAGIINAAAAAKGNGRRLDMGGHTALARLDPDAEFRPHQLAALCRALIDAGLNPDETWLLETWRRWALIAHGMALAGHDHSQPLGQQLSAAGVSEARVTRLLTARDDAFRQLVPRLLRLLASKRQAPNWFDLGDLIRSEGRDEKTAERIRLKIAAGFFSAEAKK
ncbi:type I-E CRISPR-associated protein Cse2/CasB [Candidatus Accumulibacter vicinus]|uniref:CRISPR-associated protein Cse2 (CRISPR_cse2) n=1 Tax=Candidatus Accumulibacter vicinus TaxID=2954382 RepID=A0A084Y3X7_9PROT|nr:type I-E CRISPR-associated protein Cse2/CasB [Candidatus Accumulibacter vicinus]KFB69421.1 MAG: CRISPR-associated protein Cse2 (CRISPR_cse2) [Candidatus Accumulibacter vicinus]